MATELDSVLWDSTATTWSSSWKNTFTDAPAFIVRGTGGTGTSAYGYPTLLDSDGTTSTYLIPEAAPSNGRLWWDTNGTSVQEWVCDVLPCVDDNWLVSNVSYRNFNAKTVTSKFQMFDLPNGGTGGSSPGRNSTVSVSVVGGSDITLPVSSGVVRYTCTGTCVRIGERAYLSLHRATDYGEALGTNFFAVRWDVTGDEGTFAVTETYAATAASSVANYQAAFQGGVYDADTNAVYWWTSDDADNPTQIAVDLDTAAVTLDESPDLSTFFDYEQARKALVPATHSYSWWCNNVGGTATPTAPSTISYADIAVCTVGDGIQKTIDITGTAKSEMFDGTGVQGASEEAFSGSVGSSAVFAVEDEYPVGHPDHAATGGVAFWSMRTSGGTDTWLHPYTAADAATITGPPGSACAGPGGGGHFIQLDGNGRATIYDSTCTAVATGGIPGSEISFTKAGRILYVLSGGEVVVSYIIPEATWDALSYADQQFVGWYQSGGDRLYIPPVGYTITIADALEFTMGYYAERMGNYPRLWYISQQNFQWGCLITAGNALVMTEFYPADVEAADKVVYGSRVDQPTLTYAEALSAVTNANDPSVVVPVI